MNTIETFTSAKEPLAVSMEVMQRGKEFLATVAPGRIPENPYPTEERQTLKKSKWRQ